jgi:hypothetical protein
VLGAGFAAVVILVFKTSIPSTSSTSRFSAAPAARDLFVRQSKSVGQQFVQVSAASPLQNGAGNGAPVLANFQMARDGRKIMVYDADGSVYRGTVVEPAPTREGYRSRGENKDGASAGASNVSEELEGVGNYSFQVSGLNNNLKKNVVFTGDVFQSPMTVLAEARAASPPPGAAPVLVAPSGGAGFGGQNQNAKAAASQTLRASNALQQKPASNQLRQLVRVIGKVQVGGGEFEIEAQPPAPPRNPGP